MIKIIKSIVPKDQKYHFAVSMGVDSVAAYVWMRMKDYDVVPVHFNHGLRPQNNLMESKYRELCEATNAEPTVGYGSGLKTENDCRHARLVFYSTFGYNSKIITAHHINDWIESYLLNCFRGCPRNDVIYPRAIFTGFSILHPFLLSRKKDFAQFAKRNDLMKFVVEDETNSSTSGSRRNWIRNMILPEMARQEMNLEKFAKRQITDGLASRT